MRHTRQVRRRANVDRHNRDAVPPDPVRRFTTFLVAAGLVAALLILADALVYLAHGANSEAYAPLVLDIWDRKGDADEKERGKQKIEKVEKPEENREKPKEPVDFEEVPLPLTPEPEKPVAPTVATADDNRKPGVIGTEPRGRAGLGARQGGAGREQALAKYGGGAQTENAVRKGLRWLALHQDPDGRWSRVEYMKNHAVHGERCKSAIPLNYRDTPLDPAMTGLAMLCFLAHNNTHRRGPYKRNVAAAVKYLRSTQTENGLIGGDAPRLANYYKMYNHGIATFALAELLAMTDDPRLEPVVRKAAQYICRRQKASGAWSYDHPSDPANRYDTSVTGWQVMALKSARVAGVNVPPLVVYRMAKFIEYATLNTGEVLYANQPPSAGRKGQGMVAVGLASAQFLGMSMNRSLAERQTAIILRHPPDWSKLAATGVSLDSIYYWYYATLAMFQIGGEPWDRWNRQMKRTLLTNQRQGGAYDGSWDPPSNFWGRVGGRLYSTTLNILNLEIYYRYLPIHEKGGALDTVAALIDVIEKHGDRHHPEAVRLLALFEGERARGYLLQMAHGDNPRLAMRALSALARVRDKRAVAPLIEQARSPDMMRRIKALSSLQPMLDDELVPVFLHALDDKSALVRRKAVLALRQYGHVSFGFEPESPSVRDREAAIAKWTTWWKGRVRGEQTAPPKSELPWLIVKIGNGGLVAFHTGGSGSPEKGRTYNVYRDAAFIGRVRVVKVADEACVARTVDGGMAGQVQVGDVVKPGM
jgi:hypothetical protein